MFIFSPERAIVETPTILGVAILMYAVSKHCCYLKLNNHILYTFFVGAPNTYNCTFPAMIDDWRAKWYQHSGSLTDPLFPFGFVQVASF